MSRGALFVVGIGPGVFQHLSGYAVEILRSSDVVVGYSKYIKQIESFVSAQCIFTGMGEEKRRCEVAIELARAGKRVSLVSSGDPGIYGMASLVLSMAKDVDVEVVPGIPALSFAASRVGVPLGGDFALVSLSDLLVPWEKIVFTLDRVSLTDVPIVIVNPGSKKRKFHLSKAVNTIARYRDASTPVAIVENAFQPDERTQILKLADLEDVPFTSMNTTVFVGCSRTKVLKDKLVTDRGYFDKGRLCYHVSLGVQDESAAIENFSLSFVRDHLKAHDFDPWEVEVVARMVHAVADFSIASLVSFNRGFVKQAVGALKRGCTLLVDTQMAKAGISRSYAERLGVSVMSIPKPKEVPDGYTRLAWGLRDVSHLLKESILVVGNAPTVLLEAVKIYEETGIFPKAVVALPVGFVGTVEAKRSVEKLPVPSLVLEGNRGGTPLAVAAVNALLRIACE